MTALGILQIVVYFVVVLAITKPVGAFMVSVFQGQRTFLHPLLRPVERLIYRLAGVREDTEQRWTQYAASLIAFSVASFLFVYVIQRLQGILPFNPMHFGTKAAPSGATPVTPDLAFNTAMSFLTNTNWQAYSGEMTFSYFVQMAALAVQNFASAAVGYLCCRSHDTWFRPAGGQELSATSGSISRARRFMSCCRSPLSPP